MRSGHFLVEKDYTFAGDGPKSFAVGALEQVLYIAIGVHVNFDAGTGAAYWAFHGAFSFPAILPVLKYTQTRDFLQGENLKNSFKTTCYILCCMQNKIDILKRLL